MESLENHLEVNNLPEVSTDLELQELSQLNVEKVESIHDIGEVNEKSEEKNETTCVKDSETSKSPTSIKVKKKKKAAGFQAPNKASSMSIGDADGKAKAQKIKEKKLKKSVDPVEQGLNEDMKTNKDEKSEKKKKPKKSSDTQKGVETKEVKPKKTKKSITKQNNDADMETDSVKLKNIEKPNVACDAQVLPPKPIPTECSKVDNATETKQKKVKKVEKKENDNAPVKTLSTEEWEQLFQSAIDRVMNTPLYPVLTQDEELVHNKPTQDEHEEEEEDGNMDLEDNSQDASSLTADIPNEKQEIVGPEQIQESRNHDFPVENEHILMVECAQVQELNENTPEGSEHEFNGEEDKKQQHTPVVLLKKLVKSSAAKVLAPRQLQFPQPTGNPEKKKKDYKEIHKGKNKVIDGMQEREKKKELAKNKKDMIKDQSPRSRKELLMEREIEETGTWVQCSNTACHKWRFLQDINDPTEIDEKWTCEMNDDTTYDSCEKGEQDYDESEHIYTRYSEGSIVWARMVGYPWWPAMVEIDPDTETFFELVSENSMFPSHYHVVYLDNKVSRAWVKASSILPFHRGGEDLNKNLYLTKKAKGPNFKKEVDAATLNAVTALELPIKERLKQFSFSTRFKGKWAEDWTKSRKIKKHCRVKLTPKKSKNKPKKSKEHTAGSSTEHATGSSTEHATGDSTEHQDLVMYMLDSATVDEVLSEQPGEPDSILKGIEDVLDSLGSQILSDDNDEDYLPANSERGIFTESTETRKDVSPIMKLKGTKRKNLNKEGEKSVSKKSKQQKLEDVSGTASEDNKKKRVEKIKKLAVKKAENKSSLPVGTLVELAEMKVKDGNVSKNVGGVTEENVSAAKSTTTQMKFDSDIFTMELDDEECENKSKHGKKKSKCMESSRPVTPERKNKSKSILKPEKKKSKKNLFAVPETASNGKASDEHAKNSSDNMVSPKKSVTQNDSSPIKKELMENKSSRASETTSEDVRKNVHMSPKKKSCPKKVSFSAPATVAVEPTVTVTPVNNEAKVKPCSDEQTVPDIHTQESDEEDGFSLDLPVCDQKPAVQEIRITSVATLPVVVDTEDAYDSDPFDLMEE